MEHTIPLEPYTGRPYFISIRGEPDLENPDEFAATVYYKDSERQRTVPVARIDTAHGYTHLDKLFLEGDPKESIDVDLWGAVEHLTEHHPEYARKHRDRTER